jgi:hypothetical protein
MVSEVFEHGQGVALGEHCKELGDKTKAIHGGGKSSNHRGGLEIALLPKRHAMQMWSLCIYDTLTNPKVEFYKLVQHPIRKISINLPMHILH